MGYRVCSQDQMVPLEQAVVTKIRAQMELLMQKHQYEQKARFDRKLCAPLEYEEGDGDDLSG